MPEITDEQLKEFQDAKANAEALAAAKEKLEKDLEDTRMEVLSPEYTAFLNAQEESKRKPAKKEESSDDDLSKLTPKQLLERAKKEVLDEIESKNKLREEETSKERAARTAREIASFAKEHSDYEQFRPIMYGLSLDPKNTDLGLAQLYEKAKSHVKSLKTGFSEEDKDRSRRSSNERPGHDSSSLDKLKKMSNEEIGMETLKELGPIPLG